MIRLHYQRDCAGAAC